uniref:Mos1 transposase HTH domain-containing protein n=1 Tax=Lutzomyia longipalpis TaxID=7200 RepID=A0A1B0CT66_LUTLO
MSDCEDYSMDDGTGECKDVQESSKKTVKTVETDKVAQTEKSIKSGEPPKIPKAAPAKKRSNKACPSVCCTHLQHVMLYYNSMGKTVGEAFREICYWYGKEIIPEVNAAGGTKSTRNSQKSTANAPIVRRF